MSSDTFFHRNFVAKPDYNKRFKPIGISFDEYCDYIYKGHKENFSRFDTSTVYGVDIKRVGTFSFLQNVEEVLIDEVYKFESDTDNPYIIDCGVNIGLSIIYFKRLYPRARILGFEPDKQIFGVCNDNLKPFNFTGINLHNAAVWNADGELSFLPDNSLGGMVVSENRSSDSVTKVKAERLKSFLGEKIDFLKIDIEGAELDVLEDCKDDLANVKSLFVEYHSSFNRKQELHKILAILTNAGFRYFIKEALDYMKYPFVDYKKYNSANLINDLQLNIFAYRRP